MEKVEYMSGILLKHGLIKRDELEICDELLKIVSKKIEEVADLRAREWYINEVGNIISYRLGNVTLKGASQLNKFMKDIRGINSIYQIVEYLKHERASTIKRIIGIDDFEDIKHKYKGEYIIIDHNKLAHVKKKVYGDRLLTIELGS